MTGNRSTRPLNLVAAVPALGLLVASCAGSLPGAVSEEPPAPKVDIAGRWLLSTPNAPSCGVTFRSSADPNSGTVAPEGGCPGNFFTSRQWAFEQGHLVIRNHNSEALAQLSFVDQRFEGKSTSGMQVTLNRATLPSN